MLLQQTEWKSKLCVATRLDWFTHSWICQLIDFSGGDRSFHEITDLSVYKGFEFDIGQVRSSLLSVHDSQTENLFFRCKRGGSLRIPARLCLIRHARLKLEA